MGIVSRMNKIYTKTNEEMAFLEITDRLNNKIEIVVFPKVFDEAAKNLGEGKCIYVEGNVDQGKVLASRLTVVPKRRDV